MRILRRYPALVLIWVLFLPQVAVAQLAESDVDTVLAAMMRELERSNGLRMVDLDDAYFVEYTVDDTDTLSIVATLGAVVSENRSRMRVPRIKVRVGSREFDNTNYVFSDYYGGRSPGLAPIDNDEAALQSYFWLATDRAYKGALTAIARKRAALKNVNLPEQLPDFTEGEKTTLVIQPREQTVDDDAWAQRLRALSAVFADFPKITRSSVRFSSIQSNVYLVNSEESVVRYPESLNFVEIRAGGQAPDGMLARDARAVVRLDIDNMPSDLDLKRSAQAVAENVSALIGAQAEEPYIGPVLFEGEAASQLFAQVLGSNLAVPRRPVPEPGRPIPFQASELEGRIGSRVLPDFMNVVDDPTQIEWRGQPLIGHYPIDIEGVVPKPLRLVESGILKSFLLTRQPVDGFAESNGRARLPGQFGASSALMSNFFVQATETVTEAKLKARLLEMCEARGKEYGFIVRKLDFPSSASIGELRRIANAAGQRGGGSLVSAPILIYKVYSDGREELVRGLQFRSLPVRALRDIVAASDQGHLFSYLGSNAPLSLMGAGGFVTAISVVAPSVLIEDIELDRSAVELPKLPVAPPPPLVASQ